MNLGQLTSDFATVDPNALFNPTDFGASADYLTNATTLTAPDISAYIPSLNFDTSSVPNSYNAVTGAPPSAPSVLGLSYNDLQLGLGALATAAKLGVQTYASVNQVQRGAGSAYAFTPQQLNPPANDPYANSPNQPGGPYADPSLIPPDATAAFSMTSLTDFTTPYPYVAIGGVLLLLWMVSKKKKGKGH